jgi:uncharacterized protein
LKFELVSEKSDPPVRGYLHRSRTMRDALVLTHGAGGNAKMGLLVALAEGFAADGVAVLRCDLPFRQERGFGPPRPGQAERDRAGLQNAVAYVRTLISGRVFLGGQSYGGRQATMLCAEQPELAQAMLLLSYPLHAPGKPEQLRVQHFPGLSLPCLFVQGTRDPFATVEEIRAALKLIPGRTELMAVDNAGHDLGFKGKVKREELPGLVVSSFQKFVGA